MEVSMIPAWKNAAAALDEGRWTYGDMIMHAELWELLDLPEPQGRVDTDDYKRWQFQILANVEALKDYALRTHSMLLASVHGEGYRILHPGEQTEYATRQGMRELRRELRRMSTRLFHVARHQLTADQLKENTDALARTAAISQTLRSVGKITAPTEEVKELA